MGKLSLLAKTMKNFTTPLLSIIIEGEDISKEIAVESLNVDLSIGQTANACRFEVSNIYDYSSSKIKSEIIKNFVLGNKVEIKVGFTGAKAKTVFYGYICAIDFSASPTSGSEISVTCTDVRTLMKEVVNNIQKLNSDATSIVTEVLNKYKPFVEKVSVDLPELENDKNMIINKKTDLAFIINLSEERNRVFYIIGKEAFVEERSDSVCFTYEWDRSLFSLSAGMNYLDKSYMAVNTSATDKGQETSLKFTYPVKQPGKQNKVGSFEIIETFTSTEKNQADLEINCKGVANKALVDCQTGSITTVGAIDVLPGKAICIEGFPFKDLFDTDTFYVTAVNHEIGSEGFTTSVKFNLGV